VYKQYRYISLHLSGWTLESMKQMTVRERTYWVKTLIHRQSLSKQQG